MNPYMAFIFGGIVGILINKVWNDYVARKKKAAILETAMNALERIVENVSTEENADDESENDNLLDLKKVLNDLRDREHPQDE